MKKVICKVEYNTEISTIVKKVTNGLWGDPKGYEETLYQMPNGKFFLYVNGGEDSIYPQENIKRLSAAKAQEWLENNQ